MIHWSKVKLLLFLVLFCQLATQSPVDAQENGLGTASLTLVPGAQTYTAAEAAQGKVHFMATIANKSDEVLVIAHPLACFPQEYQHGDQLPDDFRRDKSEILLSVLHPLGETVALREAGFLYFEPGNMDYLYILPNSSKSFYVGWFFQNSRGRWDDNELARKLFSHKGEYTVSITYRNLLPKAAVRTNPMEKPEFITPWMGEMTSEAITIQVE